MMCSTMAKPMTCCEPSTGRSAMSIRPSASQTSGGGLWRLSPQWRMRSPPVSTVMRQLSQERGLSGGSILAPPNARWIFLKS